MLGRARSAGRDGRTHPFAAAWREEHICAPRNSPSVIPYPSVPIFLVLADGGGVELALGIALTLGLPLVVILGVIVVAARTRRAKQPPNHHPGPSPGGSREEGRPS